MGSINLDNTGSGSGITLSSDGTSLLLDGTAIGGGGADLFAENYDGTSTLPSATGNNAVAIGKNASASGSGGFASGNGAAASGTNSVALGRANTASGQNAFSFGFSNTASGTYAIAIHGNATADETTAIGRNSAGNPANATTGQGAMALGGSYASGTDSFAAAIANNTSSYGTSGTNSIAMGYQAKATQSNAVSIGSQSQATGSQAYGLGQFGVASANYAYCLGGFSTASGYGSYAIGTSIAATSQYSVAMGRRAKTTVEGQYAFTGEWFSAQGDSQTSTYVLRSDTTDATAEAMVTDGPNETRGTNNQIVLPNNSAYAFHGTIVARQQAADGTACAAWKVEGLIRREANAGTTVLVNSATTVLDNTPSWGMALSADTTNGCLKIEVTGAASTDIRWVATIHTSEVTYA